MISINWCVIQDMPFLDMFDMYEFEVDVDAMVVASWP